MQNLKKQKVEQQQRVKDAAPDEKTLKQLEKTIGEYRKGMLLIKFLTVRKFTHSKGISSMSGILHTVSHFLTENISICSGNYYVVMLAEYETAQNEYEKVEDEKHALHKQIMDIGGTKLKTAESKLIMINNQIDTTTGRITKANVAVKTAQR